MGLTMNLFFCGGYFFNILTKSRISIHLVTSPTQPNPISIRFTNTFSVESNLTDANPATSLSSRDRSMRPVQRELAGSHYLQPQCLISHHPHIFSVPPRIALAVPLWSEKVSSIHGFTCADVIAQSFNQAF